MIDLRALRKSHDNFLKQHERVLDEAAEFAGLFAIREARTKTGFTPRTGQLQRANKHKVIRTSGGRLIRLTNRKPYARAIDRGAKPHVITAKGGGFLRFKTRGGNWVRTKSVNHPGNRPYRFLRNAAGEGFNVFGARYVRKMHALLRRRL